jgi:hypothetical protein
MGGWGSGGWQSGKDTTSGYHALDIRWLQRQRMLSYGTRSTVRWSRGGEEFGSIQVRSEADRFVLNYRVRRGSDEWQDKEYPLNIVWTNCHLGGRRPWFLCPAVGCGRRVAVLYGGANFACRHCHQLAYGSQRDRADDRACRRADKIRARLGWEPGILNGEGEKPKGMHWRTFDNLIAAHDKYVTTSLAYAVTRFGR